METGLTNSDLLNPPYAANRVVIKAIFDDDTKNAWFNGEDSRKAPIFQGSGRPGMFNVHPWDPLFEYEGNFQYAETFPKVLGTLNGWGGDDLQAALAFADETWLADLMSAKIRYVGHPTKQWDDTVTKPGQSMGVQIHGVRQFFAVEESPLNKMMEMVVPTISKGQEYSRNLPHTTMPGKVPAVLVPVETKDIAIDFERINTAYLTNTAEFHRQFNTKYERTSKLVNTLKAFHKFCLWNGIGMLYSIIRDGVLEFSIPNDSPISPTEDPAGRLSKDESINWITALATDMCLLPNQDYQQIQRRNRDQQMKSDIKDWSVHVLKTLMPSNDGRYLFGFDKETGENEGYDINSNRIKRGTVQGDMIEGLLNSTPWFMTCVSDWIYYATRNIVGRVITPARKYSFGSFI